MTKDHLSITGKKWTISRENLDEDIVLALKNERNISDNTNAKLSDPMLFPEMAKAVERIKKALASKEVVGIFGDYDADGVTGTAQLLRYFRRHGTEPVVHLPHRSLEGYGMKKLSIDALHAKGVTLLVTVDTGIAAHEEIAYASSLGMDVIITDHHRPQGGRPDAYAVIHPQVPSQFPNPHLCGAGVAFMLVRALERTDRDTSLASDVSWDGIDLDIALATIGTIGDLVPLTGENRTLVMNGLKFLAKLPPSPLRDFLEEVKGDAPITASDIAFRVVPRINAAGRMAHPDIALKAILEGGDALTELHTLNGDRRTFVDELDATHSIEDDDNLFIVVTSEQITPGTAGLLASRFTERTGRPSLVGAVMGETVVASLRGPKAVDIVECLQSDKVSALLLSFGGHAQAAGCTFLAKNTDALRIALSHVLHEGGINIESLKPVVSIDAEIPASHLTMSMAKNIASLEPFGSGNPEPVFFVRAQIISDTRAVGSEKTHLQCRVGGIKAIGFGLGAHAENLGSSRVDIACRLGVNTWQGRESVQIFIEDIREARL